MSLGKFPLEGSDSEGTVDAVNYLLSGPSGLGQNFSGYSSYTPIYLRPSSRQPFVTPTATPIKEFFPISLAEPCDITGTPVALGTPTRYVKFTYTTPFTEVIFSYGQFVDIIGVTPSYYNDSYQVWTSTLTYTIIYTTNEYVYPAYVSGGSIGIDYSNITISTDCNGRSVVNSGNDRVFVSGQLILNTSYSCSMASEFDIVIQIRRLTGYLSTIPGNNDYVFARPESIVALRQYHYSVSAPGTITDLETIFTQFIDGPQIDFGYYWYLLEFTFKTVDSMGVPYPGDISLGPVELGLRSLTSQVVKQ